MLSDRRYLVRDLKSCPRRADRNRMSNVESADYLAPNSGMYRKWLHRQPHRRQWDSWLMMGIIGICMGLITHVLSVVSVLKGVRDRVRALAKRGSELWFRPCCDIIPLSIPSRSR